MSIKYVVFAFIDHWQLEASPTKLPEVWASFCVLAWDQAGVLGAVSSHPVESACHGAQAGRPKPGDTSSHAAGIAAAGRELFLGNTGSPGGEMGEMC